MKMKFKLGDEVTKVSGSKWTGKIVGTYSTELTPIGYCVESNTEKGSVQIYPEKALLAYDVMLSAAPSAPDATQPQPPQISGTLTVVLEALAWADGHLDSELLKRAICKVQGALGTTQVPPPLSAAFRRGYQYARNKIDAANKETVMESLEAQSSDGNHDFDKGVRQCLFDEGRK